MPTLATRNPSPTIVQDDVDLPPKLPELPADVLKRFPSLEQWKEDQNAWWSKTYSAIQGNNRWISQSVTNANQTNGDLTISFGIFTASITTQLSVITTEQGAQARRIVTVSAMAGLSTNYKIQNAAPVGPAVNDVWTNNTDLLNPITYKWSGAAWVEVTDPISVAGVATEYAARVLADGYLEGKYSLTVIAGNIVTGMNITSASGPGTNISSVIFRATDFRIYNGTLGLAMFTVSGSNVNLAGALTVSTAGKVFTGTGTYGNANTPFYVDSSSNFSLGDKLTFNGTTLTIAGGITATTGTIGGWTIAATTLSKNNAVLDSAGRLALGTGNDIVILSATDATYRLWIGNATSGSAAFSVTKGGVLSATGATITGGTVDIGTGYAKTLINSSGVIFGNPATGGNSIITPNAGGSSLFLRYQTNTYATIESIYDSGYANFRGNIRLHGYGGSYGTSDSYLNPYSLGVNTSNAGTPIINLGSDTNLYRYSANILKTDDALLIGNFARVESSGYPSAGAGLELAYDSSTYGGIINAYDRSGAAFKPLLIEASVISLGINSAQRTNFVGGSGASAPGSTTPAAWLDVRSNGGAYKMALYT